MSLLDKAGGTGVTPMPMVTWARLCPTWIGNCTIIQKPILTYDSSFWPDFGPLT
nr:AlNc14C177G8148 [Albugo laibachii Nc14]|eukprot:CCA23038.1 AlNc14C177G8148 [Albugo laibachii Nc14]